MFSIYKETGGPKDIHKSLISGPVKIWICLSTVAVTFRGAVSHFRTKKMGIYLLEVYVLFLCCWFIFVVFLDFFKDAVSKYQEVTNNLEFAKELQRSFMALSQDVSKDQALPCGLSTHLKLFHWGSSHLSLQGWITHDFFCVWLFSSILYISWCQVFWRISDTLHKCMETRIM